MNTNMHKLSLVLIGAIAMLSVSLAMAQTYTGDLTLSTQAEVDAFGYSEVTGSLTISGDDIVALDALSGLTSIGGNLSLGQNPALLSAENVFPNLTNIGWGIYLYRTSLVTFSGFDALLSTGDNIDFWYNASLTSVSGFSALQTAGWSLEFGGNPVLTIMPEFASLQTITSSLFILDNFSLSRISGFNALEYVDWSFTINGNGSLENLCGFYNYLSISDPYTGRGSFSIDGNSPNIPNPMPVQNIMDAGPCFLSPEEQIDQLMLDIEVMGFANNGIKNKLLKSLDKVKKSVQAGKLATAVSELESLMGTIADFEKSKKIDGATADILTSATLAIIVGIDS